MANIPACLVAHMRADATLIALLAASGGATRINLKFDTELSPELPQIYIGGGEPGQPESTAIGTRRFSIWAEGATSALCLSIHDRLRQLFHDKTGYTLGASPNTVKCTLSKQATTPAPENREDHDPWEYQAFYEFTVVEAHGF